jgi:hypothetical protein
MLFPAVVGDDQAEVGYARVKNVSGATRARGDAVVWDISAPDGVRVSVAATATLSLLAGVLIAELTNNSYGLAQAFGYNTAAKVINSTDVTIVAGDILVPVNAQVYLAYHADSTNKKGLSGSVFYADADFATATTPAAVLKKIFIHNL